MQERTTNQPGPERTLPGKNRTYAYLVFVLTLLAGMLAVPAGTVQATPPIGTGQTIEFDSTAIDVGSHTGAVNSVAVGDLDRDGDLDIVAAGADNAITIWQNNGIAGTWTSQTVGSHTEFSLVTSVAVGDLDGDGKLDIVSAGTDNNVKVWRNNRTPFAAGWSTSQTVGSHTGFSEVTSVAVGDLDGDGKLDIVSAGTDNNVKVWRNNGNPFRGTWSTTKTVGSHTSAVTSVAVGDLDGDGNLDIVSGGWDKNVKVWQNDGTPFADAWASQTVGSHSDFVYSVAVGDLDGDGNLDIVSGEQNFNRDSNVNVWRNDGTPFDAAVPWVSQTAGSHRFVNSVAVGDLDGDGDLDIVSGGYDNSGSKVNVWQNDSTPFDAGAWASQTAGSHGDYVNSVVVGDLDRDGDLDLISGGQDNRVKAWQNKQVHRNMPFNSTATDVGSIDGTIWVLSVAVGDLDGDGDLDIVSGGGTGSITIWQNNGTPFAAGWSTSRTVGSHADSVRQVAVGDLDGDGDLDIASAGRDNVKIWENDGTPFDGAWIGQTVGSHNDVVGAVAVEAVAVGDLDGDGDLDLLSGGFDNKVRIWLNDGTPFDAGAWASRIFDGHTSAVMAVAVGDLNGDGNLDILSGGQDFKVMAWQNWGIDPFDEITWWWEGRTIIGSHTGVVQSVAVGDMDGDGDLDIVSSDDSLVFHGDNRIAPSSSIKVWRHNGRPFDGDWTNLTVGSLTESVEAVAVGDLDGDGDLDIASAGWDKNVNVWRNDGTPFADAWASQTVGSHTGFIDSVAVGDLDGDGDLDLVSPDRDNKIKAWQNQGGSAGFAVTDTSPGTPIGPGSEDDVFKVVFTHNGITGDRDLELSQWNLNLFDDGDACSNPMETATANSLLDMLRVRLDDGDGIFESDGSDVQVAEIDTFALTGGVQTVSFTNDDANVQVGPTNSRTYWVSLLTNAPSGDICLQFDPDAGAVVEGKTPDFSVSIQDSSPTKTTNSVPTAVTIADFRAQAAWGNGPQLAWETGDESSLSGFHIWRGSAEAAESRLTDSLIGAAGGLAGREYTWQDGAALTWGQRTFYWLEAVEADGSSSFTGPVEVVGLGKLFLPTVGR